MPTPKARFKRRFLGFRPWTRHSVVLTVAGLVYIGIGIIYIAEPPTSTRELALAVALAWAPIKFWGSLWVIVGILALISAKWPPQVESLGYMALTGWACGWSATYAAGVIFEGSPPQFYADAAVWALLAFLWWAISGLVNPTKAVIDDGLQDNSS